MCAQPDIDLTGTDAAKTAGDTGRRLKIVADAHIPWLDGAFDAFADLVRVDPADICRDTVAGADALLVRTRTRCDAALLQDSTVRFVGTATIGFDHIDRRWCAANGITAVNAPGCNAPAVAQYVFAAINALGIGNLTQKTIAIVGVGNVGRIVERWARALGMDVMLCDPPRARAEGTAGFCTLDDIARRADIITFHTPLTQDGPDKTLHLADDRFFDSLERRPVIINAARGAVVDNTALLHAIKNGRTGKTVLDVWEGEPRLLPGLPDAVDIATPHIAGYSAQGKARASYAVARALCRTFGKPFGGLPVPEPAQATDTVTIGRIAASYDIMADDAALRRNPGDFETLRNKYALRNEPAL